MDWRIYGRSGNSSIVITMRAILVFIILFSGNMFAQDLSKHQWKDRLLIIYAEKYDHPLVQEQLEMLAATKDKLKDLKLKVYVVTGTEYWFNFSEEPQPLFKQQSFDTSFKVVLVGLDGGEKFISETIRPMQDFVDLINEMPMRKTELKNRKKG